ncbi:MAG TPA: NAD(P)H-dependent oxidoreductase [Ilumatobacteraceae bacterium]
MKVHLVYCHPDPDSFTRVVRDRAVGALHDAGHDVRVADLYADDFDPQMSSAEVAQYLDPPDGKVGVASYCADLAWCEVLVFIYPTWWSAQPAMLTGWFDRVLIRGVAWELPPGATRISGRLGNVRHVVAITTHGSSRFINVLEGETGRRVIGRAVRVLCHPLARTRWLSLYGIDRSTPARREKFLARVERRMHRL